MSPGDNFRVAASLDSSKLQDPYLTQGMADSGVPPDGVAFSPMLTVWRHLWIESDRMANVPTTGDEKNFVAGTGAVYEPPNPTNGMGWVQLNQNLPDAFDDEDQFKYGVYVAGTFSYPTYSSTANWINEDQVKIKGDPIADGAPTSYQLYDDDAAQPQNPQLGTWASIFNNAYIEPAYLPTTFSSVVPFQRNLSSSDVAWGTGTWNDQYGAPSTSDFWTELVVGAFQPETSKDYDPDNEQAVAGAAKVYGDDNQCVIYCETIRDLGVSAEKSLAHEIGHGAGIEDNDCEEGCIMWRDINNQIGDHFCDKCIAEMRNDAVY